MSPQRRRRSLRLIERAEGNLGVLQTDLLLEIISRLPSKSIARFRYVSKQWASLLTLGSPYFTELFLTQSRTRPRLLFAIERDNHEWCLYSCPQAQISYKNSTSSISVTAEFHMALPKTWLFHMANSVSGLIYFPNIPLFKRPVLCNPSTRQHLLLPHLARASVNFLGYDPINKQFSVLAFSHGGVSSSYQILKLGTRKLSWRRLNCPLHHLPLETNICINGTLYYMASFKSNPSSFKIASFDLNSEEFKFIDQPWYGEPHRWVNFKGKLGGIKTNWFEFVSKRSHFTICLWVLEDASKQDWSKHVYDILPTELWDEDMKPYFIVGMTATGDIVLTLYFIETPLYVYFINVEKKTLQKIEIKGLEEFKNRQRLFGCVDYVEELRDLKWS